MTTRIVIESCENPDESYTFEGSTIAGTIAECINEFTGEVFGFNIGYLTVELADLLETIAAAMRRYDAGEPPVSRYWDFSSPENAYYVLFFEDSEDDDGTPAHVVWERSITTGDQAEVIPSVAPEGWDEVEA